MEEAFKSFCLGGMEGYFKNITSKKYILDKSRGWAINYGFINAFVSALDREFERSLSFFEDVIIQDKKVFEENKFLINNLPLEMQLLLKIRIY